MKVLPSILLFFVPLTLSAQTPQKIGHADWEFIFSQLPEYKQIEAELRAFEAQLQNQIKNKTLEFEQKYQVFQSLSPDTPEPIKNDKATELTYLRDNLEKFRQDAQASMQKKQTDLINPVFHKVAQAIEGVAKEEGYAYILNPQMMTGGDVLLFADERYNISALVLKKLGVAVKPQTR